MTALETPFQIGQELWAPVSCSENIEIPCPVCAGNLFVTVILGDGEHVAAECDACGHGLEGPKGTIKEWRFTPAAHSFVIASVVSFYGDRWRVRSTSGAERDFNELRESEAAALAESARCCQQQEESNMQSRQRARKNVKHATWSLLYHRQHIADLERQIAWHRSKIEVAKGTTV